MQGNNAVSGLGPLPALSNAAARYWEGNPITDLSPLSTLPHLQHLTLRGMLTTADQCPLKPNYPCEF